MTAIHSRRIRPAITGALARLAGMFVALMICVLIAACSSTTTGGSRTTSPSVGLPLEPALGSAAPGDDPLAGTWMTDKITVSQWVKAFIAAGFSEKDAHQYPPGGAEQYAQVIFTFDHGTFTEQQSGDGHDPVVANRATYKLGTAGTVDFVTDVVETYGYVLNGETLKLHFVKATCPGDCGPPVGPTLYGSFPFTRQSTAAASPTPAPIADGTYATPALTYDLVKAALVAHKISKDLIDRQMLEWTSDNPDGKQILTIRLHAGTVTYIDRGGSIGWRGTFSFTDAKTMAADDGFGAITYGIRWDGPKLYLRILSDLNPNPGDIAAQAGGFEAAWFTLQP